MVDALEGGIAFVILLQMATFIVVISGKTKAKAPKKEKEGETAEANRLKGILADSTRLGDYAMMKFKGNEEKAKKALQERIRKLTGEVLESPFS
jgi:hypothetical protein